MGMIFGLGDNSDKQVVSKDQMDRINRIHRQKWMLEWFAAKHDSLQKQKKALGGDAKLEHPVSSTDEFETLPVPVQDEITRLYNDYWMFWETVNLVVFVCFVVFVVVFACLIIHCIQKDDQIKEQARQEKIKAKKVKNEQARRERQAKEEQARQAREEQPRQERK